MPDVTGLYRRFGVRLPELGDGWASTRCFSGAHQDRHPSARVHLRAGTFRCFACGARGGVLDALQLLGVYDRDEARRLAADYGILEPPRRQAPPAAAAERKPASAPVVIGGPIDYDRLPAGPSVVQERAWTYTDAHGVPVGRVRRFDLADGTKRIWQERRDGDGWAAGLAGVRLPLYRLPQVLERATAGERVLVVEGEKAVDALDRLGLFATTCAGGAGKWRDEHSAALAGASVVVIADCDPAGRSHALDVTSRLLQAAVRVLDPLDLDELADDGSDVVDHLAALADTIRAVTPQITPTELRASLRDHLERTLRRQLPADSGSLQRRRERVRYRTEPGGRAILDCGRCGQERVHRVSHGLAFCPCGSHRAAL